MPYTSKYINLFCLFVQILFIYFHFGCAMWLVKILKFPALSSKSTRVLTTGLGHSLFKSMKFDPRNTSMATGYCSTSGIENRNVIKTGSQL